ncbi:MAG: DUF434 domain-containing protein [Euryarchaeota archaeon]|nr:DUF434 domain-containing protein [Euryarchaeota archaeon]
MKASKDLYYLLNRGYSKGSAVRFVGDHYCLTKKEGYKLKRMVFSKEEIRLTLKKRSAIEEIQGKGLMVDGYNVLITVESVLKGEAFRCFDGVIRDIQGIFHKYRFTEKGKEALRRILSLLKRYPPKETLFLFDTQISKSGELCSYVQKKLRKYSLNGDAWTTKNVDYTLKERQMLTATNDSIIIKELEYFVDIPGEIWKD